MVLIGPEKTYLSVNSEKCLKTFEDSLTVMQRRKGRIHFHGAVGLYAGLFPTAVCKIDIVHMIGKIDPEFQIVEINLIYPCFLTQSRFDLQNNPRI